MKTALLLLPALAILAGCTSTDPASPGHRFDHADVNKDGQLTRQEISRALDRKMFDARDANKDGVITANECTNGELKDHKAADTSGDGNVTLAEYSAHADKAPGRGAGFKEADANGDGMLNRAEANAYYASKE